MKQKYKFVNVRHNLLFPGRRQVKRSRLVMAESLGRCLLRTEHVHHKNEDTMDDRRKNLEIMSPGKHVSHHHLGSVRSVETKRKLSLAHRGKHFSIETRKKMSLNNRGMKGKHHTIETREKLSLAQKDKHHIVETRNKISRAMKDYRLQQKASRDLM